MDHWSIALSDRPLHFGRQGVKIPENVLRIAVSAFAPAAQ